MCDTWIINSELKLSSANQPVVMNNTSGEPIHVTVQVDNKYQNRNNH